MKCFAWVLLLYAQFSFAGVLNTEVGRIKSIYTYDDAEGGIVYIQITMPIDVCPSGAYLNREAVGFKELYSIAVAAMMANKDVLFQLYNDRINGSRCEVDAIRVYAAN